MSLNCTKLCTSAIARYRNCTNCSQQPKLMDLLHCDKPSCKYNKVHLPCKYAAYRQQQHMPVQKRLPNALCTARGITVTAAIILDCFATQEDPHTGTKSCRITCCQASQIYHLRQHYNVRQSLQKVAGNPRVCCHAFLA